ncbi:hypothetical protein N1851_016093 [Merluccius polli]|uniref:Uncharacterized protein n=1 Tax=Merluccius polli TaxID=89951 RepID=A0AA47MR17_MERPO|nr:hypothetical protein N1851_016093 [Merluccius polli]
MTYVAIIAKAVEGGSDDSADMRLEGEVGVKDHGKACTPVHVMYEHVGSMWMFGNPILYAGHAGAGLCGKELEEWVDHLYTFFVQWSPEMYIKDTKKSVRPRYVVGEKNNNNNNNNNNNRYLVVEKDKVDAISKLLSKHDTPAAKNWQHPLSYYSVPCPTTASPVLQHPLSYYSVLCFSIPCPTTASPLLQRPVLQRPLSYSALCFSVPCPTAPCASASPVLQCPLCYSIPCPTTASPVLLQCPLSYRVPCPTKATPVLQCHLSNYSINVQLQHPLSYSIPCSITVSPVLQCPLSNYSIPCPTASPVVLQCPLSYSCHMSNYSINVQLQHPLSYYSVPCYSVPCPTTAYSVLQHPLSYNSVLCYSLPCPTVYPVLQRPLSKYSIPFPTVSLSYSVPCQTTASPVL